MLVGTLVTLKEEARQLWNSTFACKVSHNSICFVDKFYEEQQNVLVENLFGDKLLLDINDVVEVEWDEQKE